MNAAIPTLSAQAEVRGEGGPLLEADGVRVEFGKLVAVDDASFAMSGGDLLGLIGPNGAGKTTLMRVLAGLHAPTRGRARVMGHDVYTESDDVRPYIAFAPDSPPAYEDLSIDEFLTFIGLSYNLGAREADERIGYWLDQLWLTDKRDEKIKNLSRGMRQRVTIARTLLPSPSVILLDEPTSGLDPAGRISLRKVIASLRDQGKAVIVSSHILADLEEFCTHIAIIERGRIIHYKRSTEVMGSADGRCRYRIALAPGGPDITAALAQHPGVDQVNREGEEYRFYFLEDPHEAAALLKAMVQQDFPIAVFEPFPESLEEAYLKTGVREVD